MHGLDPSALKANAPRPEGVTMDTDWVRPGDNKFRRKIVKTLIAEGADYEARDIMDFVPLHYAALWGCVYVCEFVSPFESKTVSQKLSPQILLS
jgi:ankyrin repeat protein